MTVVNLPVPDIPETNTLYPWEYNSAPSLIASIALSCPTIPFKEESSFVVSKLKISCGHFQHKCSAFNGVKPDGTLLIVFLFIVKWAEFSQFWVRFLIWPLFWSGNGSKNPQNCAT